MSRIYLSARKDLRLRYRLRDALEKRGHTVYDPYRDGTRKEWSEIDPDWENWPPEKIRDMARSTNIIASALQDEEALIESDVVVVASPCDDTCMGALGFAKAKGKLAIVILADGARANHFFFYADYVLITAREVCDIIEEEAQ